MLRGNFKVTKSSFSFWRPRDIVDQRTLGFTEVSVKHYLSQETGIQVILPDNGGNQEGKKETARIAIY